MLTPSACYLRSGRTAQESMHDIYGDFVCCSEAMAFIDQELIDACKVEAEVKQSKLVQLTPDDVWDYNAIPDTNYPEAIGLEYDTYTFDELDDVPLWFSEEDRHDADDMCSFYTTYISAEEGGTVDCSDPSNTEGRMRKRDMLRALLDSNRKALIPAPRKREVGRKLNNIAVDLVLYWNSKPGLTQHRLVENNGVYYQVEQTLGVRSLTRTIHSLIKGTFYMNCEDITQAAWRTSTHTIQEMKKAIDRLALSVDIKRKQTLFTFFKNERAEVFPKMERKMYMYKYPFLYYVNGEVESKVTAVAKSEYPQIAADIQKRLEVRVAFSILAKREVQKVATICAGVLKTYCAKKGTPVERVLSQIPSMFCACYDSTSTANDLSDLWFVATYKFEKYITEKRYI